MSHRLWELCLFSFSNSVKTGPFICYFLVAWRIVRGRGELKCRGTQIYLVYTFLKVYEMYCMTFHSFWLGSWNFHSHGEHVDFSPFFQVRMWLERLYFCPSVLLFIFLIYLFSPVSVSITPQSGLEQKHYSRSFFLCIWEISREFSGILPHCFVRGLFPLCKILSFLLWLGVLKFGGIDSVHFLAAAR